MDFVTLQANALDRAGLPSTDGLAKTATLKLAVNSAVQSIGAKRAWPWLYDEQDASTAADTAELALPDTASKVHFLAIGDDVLDRRQRADLVRFTDEASGLPTRWALIGSESVVLGPTPDSIYVVKFGLTLVEPVLAADADTPLLPVQFHDLIVCLAARYLATRRKDGDLVALLSSEIKEWRESMDRATIAANGPLPIRTRKDWGI